jgi:hypothetical protein
MRSRVDTSQRAQSAWQDGQPFSLPFISPPDYDTVEFTSKKEILLAQKCASNEY